MRRDFTSALANQIEAFIEFKHAAGITFTSGEYVMRRLDAYLTAVAATSLTKEAVEGFVTEYDGGRPDADRSHLSYVRSLARFLQIRDIDAHILSAAFTRTKPRPATYLLSTEEIEAFFAAASNLNYPDPWPWQATAFFAVMASCGLRTGEARKLKRGDVKFTDGTLDVLWSKGPRSRRLPLTDEVIALLSDCDARNNRFSAGRETFFVSSIANPISRCTPGVLFKRIWRAAGFPTPTTEPLPIPYAFRHHFAYANIERWAASGTDPTTMLPYLARYMGHSDIASTYYYLALSPDYAATYSTGAHTSEHLLPEVNND